MGNESNVAGAPGALPWSVVESGLWMRAGIAGAGVALVAPALVAGGEASLAGGAAAFAAGAALAVFSYRRTRGLLGMDRETPDGARPAGDTGIASPRLDFPRVRIRPEPGA